MSDSVQDAISTATAKRLRFVLGKIVSKNAEAKHMAERMFQVGIYAPSGTKRKAGDELDANRQSIEQKIITTCVQCKTEYNVLANETNACTFHPGWLDVNDASSVWDDWEEKAHGPRDECAEFPEGFVWTCCEKSGTATGCLTVLHSAVNLNYDPFGQDFAGTDAGTEDHNNKTGGYKE